MALLLALVSLNACSKEDQGNIPKGWKIPTYTQYTKCTGEDRNLDVDILSKASIECGSSFRPKPSQTELDWLKARTRERMVFVKGGTFWQGEFAHLQNKQSVLPFKNPMGYVYLSKPPYSDDYEEGKRVKKEDIVYTKGPYMALPSRQVRLDGYSMGAYMVEEQEYNLFAGAKGYPMANSFLRSHMREFDAAEEVPVNLFWEQAQEYCQWLGDQVGVGMSLPTESQWEYAARNRGEFRIFATDNGLFEDGRNGLLLIETSLIHPHYTFEYQKELLAKFKSMPPNPLGIYNLQNLSELVYDWYDPTYFPEDIPADMVLENPRGPANQVVTSILEYDSTTDGLINVETKHGRVIRGDGQLIGAFATKFTIFREEAEVGYDKKQFRCVANHNSPLK